MKLTIKELAVLAVLGAMTFAGDLLLEALPNVHLVGTLLVVATVVFRQKALYALAVYLLLNGIYAGFAIWWWPYIYVWAVLWGAVMLLPKRMNPKVAAIVYVLVCGTHGLLFGTLYAPANALLFGLNFEQMVAWIVAGFPFDLIHGISNACCGLLIMPMVTVLNQLKRDM